MPGRVAEVARAADAVAVLDDDLRVARHVARRAQEDARVLDVRLGVAERALEVSEVGAGSFTIVDPAPRSFAE